MGRWIHPVVNKKEKNKKGQRSHQTVYSYDKDVSSETASVSVCSGKISVNLHRCANYRLSKLKEIYHQGALYAHKTTSHNRRARFVLCVCGWVCVRVCVLIWWCVIKWRWSFTLTVYRDFLHFLKKKKLLLTFCVHIYLSIYLYLSAHTPWKLIKTVFKQQKSMMFFSGLTFSGLPSSSMIWTTVTEIFWRCVIVHMTDDAFRTGSSCRKMKAGN